VLAEEHGERVGLLARSTSADPDAHRVADAFAFEQTRNDHRSDDFESVWIPEKIGNVDQQIAEQRALTSSGS
jgi:hypothetical protein